MSQYKIIALKLVKPLKIQVDESPTKNIPFSNNYYASQAKF